MSYVLTYLEQAREEFAKHSTLHSKMFPLKKIPRKKLLSTEAIETHKFQLIIWQEYSYS